MTVFRPAKITFQTIRILRWTVFFYKTKSLFCRLFFFLIKLFFVMKNFFFTWSLCKPFLKWISVLNKTNMNKFKTKIQLHVKKCETEAFDGWLFFNGVFISFILPVVFFSMQTVSAALIFSSEPSILLYLAQMHFNFNSSSILLSWKTFPVQIISSIIQFQHS